MAGAIEAGSLHEGPLDMVAFWRQDAAGALVVTATFRARAAEAEPMRVVISLADGGDVALAMPCFPGALYRFRREGTVVAVAVGAPSRPRGLSGS